MDQFKKGLEGVVALDTQISFIDGVQGILKYRGIEIEKLVDLSYDAVSYLLIYGKIPDAGELNRFSKKLRKERNVNLHLLNMLKFCDFENESLDVLRTAISVYAHFDEDPHDISEQANARKTIRLIALFPTIVAAFYRMAHGLELIPPDPSLSHGENFLYMLRGTLPTALEAEAMEKDFILSAEHELNPSTFALRITASTLSDLHSAIISGLCTLKGSLHGGARKGVMDMLDDIGSPDNIAAYVQEHLEHKQKIMGFGHRVYKTYDPRALIYKDIAMKVAMEKSNGHWFDLAKEIESVMYHEMVENKHKPIYPNVDFYSGVLYKDLGIPSYLATSVFAIGRISGWIAHCMEQYSDNRVIRPRAHFI
ncbi:MAG: citrate/2-methylcitrate synthase [Methanomethylovorans sp.]|uniref:citrate/2-methylcitrate synthase n=1 Tax=Methanomethylovorans sp. TaxID=2758717 RepID=UPI000A83D9BB|nr:citrate/2-methylcitrate synthase [Methanomethylovorans sp.]